MKIEVCDSRFDPFVELSRYQREILGERGQFGASSIFIGTMRDFNEDTPVQAMTLEHYPGMTEKHLCAIATEAKQRWKISDLLIMHRVGDLLPGEPIVLLAVWSVHRSAAFDACRFLIEDLKSRAPFWKKESLQDGHRWVEKNTPA